MITLWRELEIGTTHKTSSFFATRAAEELKLLWKLNPSLLATGPLARIARALAHSYMLKMLMAASALVVAMM